MKHMICTAGGVLGGIVAALFGGWAVGLQVLIVMMAIDYVSGLIVAGVFNRSPKSPNGGLESKACLKGLIRKIFVLALVAVAHMIDRLIGTTYIKDVAVIAFCMYEAISIVENAALMGVPIPSILRKAIDIMRDKAGEDKAEKPPDESNTENSGTGDADSSDPADFGVSEQEASEDE